METIEIASQKILKRKFFIKSFNQLMNDISKKCPMYRICKRVRKKISTLFFYSFSLDKFQVDFALTDTSSEALSAPKIFLGGSRARANISLSAKCL